MQRNDVASDVFAVFVIRNSGKFMALERKLTEREYTDNGHY